MVLPSTYDYMDVLGETALENAMARDTTNSAVFEKLNLVQPFLSELNKRSAARVAADKDFAYVREDIERVKKVMGDKNISLNEASRLKEAEENEARQKARDQELKARKWPDEKIYDLTLTQADQPGLPPPLIITNGVVANTSTGLPKGMYAIRDAHNSSISNYFLWTNETLVSSTFTFTNTPKSGRAGLSISTNEVKLAGTGTNSSAAAESDDAATKTVNPADLGPEERASLVEAERILVDYISLLHPSEPLTAGRQGGGGAGY